MVAPNPGMEHDNPYCRKKNVNSIRWKNPEKKLFRLFEDPANDMLRLRRNITH